VCVRVRVRVCVCVGPEGLRVGFWVGVGIPVVRLLEPRAHADDEVHCICRVQSTLAISPHPTRTSTSTSTSTSTPPTHTLTHTQQVFFYKRAQIFAADVYGAFQGRGMGALVDVGRLTCFADYRLPVVLRVMGVLRYGEGLAAKVGGGSWGVGGWVGGVEAGWGLGGLGALAMG